MKPFPAFFAAAVLATSLAHAQQADATAPAVDAANRWLALADSSDGAGTWDQAAPTFRANISKANWSDALKGARQPLGAVKSRQLASSKSVHSLPGAPDGDYVLVQYTTRFEHKADAVETVVPMRGADGTWKVSGYFVR